MSEESTYYVPEQSKYPIAAATGFGLMAYGAATWVIDSSNPYILILGTLVMTVVMCMWWNTVITENMQGLANAQLKHSYVLGMLWFIFSEVMFFAAFFGALFYLRVIVNSWLGGEAAIGIFDDTPTDAAVANNALLWPGYETQWPVMETPDQAANGDAAIFKGPDQAMSFPGWANILSWLPLWNTAVLLTSSFTVHIAHTGLKNNNRKQFVTWLGITVAARPDLPRLAGRRIYRSLPAHGSDSRLRYLRYNLLSAYWFPRCSRNLGYHYVDGRFL